MPPSLLAVGLLAAAATAAQDETPPDAASEAPLEVTSAAVDAAARRGAKWLLERQQRDGSWNYESVRYPTGQTSFSAYALIKAGYPVEHPAIQRALGFVTLELPAETYGIASELLLLEATHDPAWLDRMAALVELLLDSELEGDWGYPLTHGPTWVQRIGRPDLSNTQYAVLGLRAAHHRGIEVPRKIWERIFERTLEYQETAVAVDPAALGLRKTPGRLEAAGFAYLSDGSRRPSGSMTAAGLTILGIVREALGEELTPTRERRLEEASELGLRWLALHWSVEENPGAGGWLGYYLYGLERVGALYETETIGEHSWFEEGARQLLKTQKDNGSWGDAPAETCFAILFLKRATAAVVSDEGVASAQVFSSPEDDLVRLHGTGQPVTTLWVQGPRGAAREALVAELGDEPRVDRVEYLVDGEVVDVVPGDPSAPWEGERFPTRHEFTARGVHVVGANVFLARSATLGEVEPLQSKGFELEVPYALEDWMLDFAGARGRNLLAGAKLTISASSEISAAEGASKCIDGRQGTRWLAAGTDELPWLRVDLERGVRANRLLLTQATPCEAYRGYRSRMATAELYLNRSKEPLAVVFEEDELRPTVVDLPKTLMVRRLELRVTERIVGTGWPKQIGLAEFALELAP